MRGARQAGFLLKPEQRINNGVAQAYRPKRGRAAPGAEGRARPTHLLSGDRQRIEIEGVSIDLVAGTGETYDQIYVWLPEERVAFAGDNFYKSWPNLYPIRGTPYRDVRQWAAQLSDYLIAADPGDRDALLLKADALEALAEELLTATGRNYYNTTAVQLRTRAGRKSAGR